MQVETLKKNIEQALPDSLVQIQSNDGHHFEAIVICEQFNGKPRVQRQQMVYAVVNQDIISGALHALSLKTFTPQAWESQINIK